jgi:hypothetical protein
MAILFVSRVFAPAQGSAVRKCNVYFRFASPAPKPRGFGLRLRAKRKRLAALGFGYGLNEGGTKEPRRSLIAAAVAAGLSILSGAATALTCPVGLAGESR